MRLLRNTPSAKKKRHIFLAYLKKVFKHSSSVREPLFSLQSDAEWLKTVTKAKFGLKCLSLDCKEKSVLQYLDHMRYRLMKKYSEARLK